jgi:HAD superfamily hydrolase (TIGR01509 family)
MTAITDTRRRSSVKAFTPAGITPMTGTSPAGSGRNSPTSAIPALSRLKYTNDKDADKDEDAVDEDPFNDDDDDDIVDMSVQILPGVRELINSLPEGKYAVATSGAKTYCHGCLNRTGITIPQVCVTADDPRLKRGKPFPDPFLLAAEDLGFDAKRCVVFEDSPSGIKAGVASGATVIAVCTSHPRHKIDSHGAHYIVETMDQVKVVHNADGTLGFTIVY